MPCISLVENDILIIGKNNIHYFVIASSGITTVHNQNQIL